MYKSIKMRDTLLQVNKIVSFNFQKSRFYWKYPWKLVVKYKEPTSVYVCYPPGVFVKKDNEFTKLVFGFGSEKEKNRYQKIFEDEVDKK